MILPALTEDPGSGPSVVRLQFDAEELAHLAIEVGDIGLWPADHADLDVALAGQMIGEDAQGSRFAGAGLSRHQSKAAFGSQMADASPERVDARANMQGAGRHGGGEGIPFEPIEGEQGLVHDCFEPSSLTLTR